jgi:flagellar biogenesis protein FliO
MIEYNRKKKLLLIVCAALLFLTAAAVSVYAQQKTPSGETKYLAEYKEPQPAAEENFLSFIVNLGKLSLALIIVIALIYLTVYLLKQFGAKYKTTDLLGRSILEIVDTLALGPDKVIYLIKVHNKRLLVVSSADKQLIVLDKIEDEQKVNEILSQMQEKWDKIHTFREQMRFSRQKKLAQESIRKHIGSLTDFINGLKRRT